MVLPRISKSFIEHVLKRHKDWIEVLKLKSMVEIENYVREVLETPDEVYRDRVRVDVEYYLRKIGKYYLCVVVVADEAITAYFISQEKYYKYRVKRWLVKSDYL
jgi:hypothetical protein